ncbi:spore coat protein U domain-containing protein [Thermomonas sp.]
MKLSHLITMGALCATTAIFNTAAAADNATVTVSANVTGTCKFNSGGSVSFTLDPSSSSGATGSVTQPAFWCTKGASYTITDDKGINEAVAGTAPHRMKHATLTEYIPYSFAYTATGSGTGKTSPINLNISASVVNADFVNASAGSYADTVTLSITP